MEDESVQLIPGFQVVQSLHLFPASSSPTIQVLKSFQR